MRYVLPTRRDATRRRDGREGKEFENRGNGKMELSIKPIFTMSRPLETGYSTEVP